MPFYKVGKYIFADGNYFPVLLGHLWLYFLEYVLIINELLEYPSSFSFFFLLGTFKFMFTPDLLKIS